MNADATGPTHRQESVNDMPYRFGRPISVYLAPREIVRLTILRSKLRDGDYGPMPHTRVRPTEPRSEDHSHSAPPTEQP
jgi:hypothetical protein